MRFLPKKELGAALVEFAIVALLLFSLIFGIVSFGSALYDQAVMTNAARTGVRAGIVFATSGNGLQGYTSYPSTCTTLTISDIYNATVSTVISGANSTAVCAANNAIKNTALINFSQTAQVPTITAITNNCATIGPSCELKVSISYPYTGVFTFFQNNSPLTAASWMYYE